ncbi:PREDICTED: putative metabolite transport protein YncC [Eufriesea mexicana]|uniref:putative metabolite transport protein YncC n=1 Tax=Eufriesea mexicana TaxID=516756 RepID=UPI00083C27A8|nr:PREDICTED: putative metabolite transport protein YncC [Eufriesea mexicana]
MSCKGWGFCHCFIIGLCGICAFTEACVLPITLVIVPFMACDLSLSSGHVTAVYAVLTLGMAVGAFLFGIIIDANGRKNSIPVTMILVSCASISLSFAQTTFLVYVSIFVLGLGLAGNNVVLRVYLIEFMPMKRRGFYLVVLDLLGLIGYVSALGLSWLLMPSIIRLQNKKFRPNSWRVLTGLGGIPNLIMACASSLLPASPRYLLYRRQYEQALMILRQIYAINNSKHADTYLLSNLDNCVRPDEEDEGNTRNMMKIIRKFCVKTYKRIQEICQTPFRCTTILGIGINFLQFPGIIWLALWSTQLLQENFDKSSKKNSTCIIDIENLALELLHNCHEMNTDRFIVLLYLSLSYILGEILLLVGIDVIGRKIFLVLSGIAGTVACIGLLFTVHNIVQIVLSMIILATYAIGRTTASILLLENYFTGVRGTIIGLSRVFPYLFGSFSKLFLNIQCLPSIIVISGILMSAAVAGSRMPDLTRFPMQE